MHGDKAASCALMLQHDAGAQMVLTLKMISAAVCYHDGLKAAKVTWPKQVHSVQL